jgi:hypothetical protein
MSSELPRSNRLIHHGFGVEGDPNDELRFHRPDRTYLRSHPPRNPASQPSSYTALEDPDCPIG